MVSEAVPIPAYSLASYHLAPSGGVPSPRRVAAMIASLPPRPPARPPGVEQVDEILPEEAEEPAGYGPDPDYLPGALDPDPTPPLPEPPAEGEPDHDPAWQG